jgi:6-phosphogluconolactonase
MNHPHSLGRLLVAFTFAVSCLLLPGCSSDGNRGREETRRSESAPRPASYWVYVGTYTGAKSKGIYRLKMDAKTGDLGSPQVAAETPSPSFLALHPGGKFMYAVNEVDQFEGNKTGAVSAFSIDAKNGSLTALNQQSSGGPGPCHLAVDPAGKAVVVANYAGGSTASLPVNADGSLKPAASVIQHKGSSTDPRRQEGPHAHCVKIDASGSDTHWALVADLGLDKVLLYRLDPASATLQPNDPPSASVKPGSGPRHLAFATGGRFLYVINEMASTITTFTYASATDAMRDVQTVSTLPQGFTGNSSTAEIQVHPSGKFVYGSNRGHDSIACFRADEKTGQLTLIGHQSTQGKTPRNFAIDPTGTFLLAANQGSDTVVVFRIDPRNGTLSPTGTIAHVPTPVCVEFVPVAR